MTSGDIGIYREHIPQARLVGGELHFSLILTIYYA